MFTQPGDVERTARDHERVDDFSQLTVWASDHTDVCHAGAAAQGFFDFVRADVGAAPNDEVLQAAGHVQLAVTVDEAKIACVGPAVFGIGTTLFAPVAVLDGRPAHADLAV